MLVASLKMIKDKNMVTKDVINVGVTEVLKNNAGLELNGTMCDYEIVCEDKKFSCHKAVLATNSKVFEVFIFSYEKHARTVSYVFVSSCSQFFWFILESSYEDTLI